MPQVNSDKLAKLREYHALVKQVIAIADKETVEEVARVLAAHIGYYERRYGQVRWRRRPPACMRSRPPTTDRGSTVGLSIAITALPSSDMSAENAAALGRGSKAEGSTAYTVENTVGWPRVAHVERTAWRRTGSLRLAIADSTRRLISNSSINRAPCSGHQFHHEPHHAVQPPLLLR